MKLTRGLLISASSALAGLSLVSALLVAERMMAAGWFWYKFHGYSDNGFTSLSKETAQLFMAAMIAIVLLSLGLLRFAGNSSNYSLRLCRLSIIVCLAAAVIYWILALSPLNHWRA